MAGLMTTEARRHGDLHGGADERSRRRDVTINLSSSDPTEGTVPGEPDLYRRQLQRGADGDGDRRRRCRWTTATSPTRLRPRSTSGDPIYAAINPADVAVTNTDNDAAGDHRDADRPG